MDLSTSISLAAACAALATCAATAIGLLIGVHVYRRQVNAQMFMEYTRRYREIMRGFPIDGRSDGFLRNGDPPESSPTLTAALLDYLDLCSEEYLAYQTGYLSADLWRVWEGEIERVLTGRLVRKMWPELRTEFDSHPEFQAYVEETQRSALGRSAPTPSDDGTGTVPKETIRWSSAHEGGSRGGRGLPIEGDHGERGESVAVQRYGTVMSYLQYENSMFWTRSWFFLVGHTGLLAIGAGLLLGASTSRASSTISAALSVLGIYLAIVWWRALLDGRWWVNRWASVLEKLEASAFGDMQILRGTADAKTHFTRDFVQVIVAGFGIIWVLALGTAIYQLAVEPVTNR